MTPTSTASAADIQRLFDAADIAPSDTPISIFEEGFRAALTQPAQTAKEAFEHKYHRSADDPTSADMLAIWMDAWNAGRPAQKQEEPSIQRYSMNPDNGHMTPTERGPWVRYVDVAASQARDGGGQG